MNTFYTHALVVKCYDYTYQVCAVLGAYVRANAPDNKASNKARSTLIAHSDAPYARDMLLSLCDAFDELSERSCYKAAGRDAPEHDKHIARAYFYRDIACWARACYIVGKEAPVITPDCPKDAEDDSDPYVKPSPKDTPMETALDALERFGDEASELSWGGEYNAASFWDACVQISDDLRSDLAADQIKNASTVTVPEHEIAGAMWEVAGDPDRSLLRTKLEAERAAREIFPDENVSQRYARVQYRTIVNFR